MPLTVALDVRSPKLTFPDGIETFTVPAASSSYADVPVRARSNGTFSIEVRVLTPDGSQLVDGPTVLKASVTRLTGLSQVVTVGAVLVLVSWWYTHLRRKRRAATSPAELEPTASQLGRSGARQSAGHAACVAGERSARDWVAVVSVRATERQRGSGHIRPAWPGNAAHGIGLPS